MADVQIAVIDPEDTQLALAAPAEAVVNVAVPGVQGPIGLTGSVTIAQAGTAATPGIRFESDPSTGIYSPGADQLAISTGGTGRLFVDASGRVGIGTSSPEAGHILQANGIIASVTPFGAFSALQTAGGTGFRWTLANDGTYQLQRTTNGFSTVTTPIFIDSSGRVGIGTSSPAQVLHVVGTSQFTSTNTVFINPNFNSEGVAFQNASNVPTIFTTNNLERARIDSSGRLLIGTSTTGNYAMSGVPSLQIEGTSAPASQLGLIRNENDIGGPAVLLGRSRGTTNGSNAIVLNNDTLGSLIFEGADGSSAVRAAQITANVDGTPGVDDMPGRLVFSVTADGAASPTEALRISNDRSITVSDGGNVVLGTTTGTKIGTATTQKIGFYNATPVVQPTAVADATDAATVITQLNALLTRMRNLGLIAT